MGLFAIPEASKDEVLSKESKNTECITITVTCYSYNIALKKQHAYLTCGGNSFTANQIGHSDVDEDRKNLC